MYKILVVDDDKSMRTFYEDELGEEGYSVLTCNDCSLIYDIIKSEDPDVIVLNVMLGTYNGLDILQDLRNIYYSLPIIIFTAYPYFKYDLRSIAADYFVTKSIDLSELKMKIQMAIDGNFSFSWTSQEYRQTVGEDFRQIESN